MNDNLETIIDFYKICLYLRNLKIFVYNDKNHYCVKDSKQNWDVVLQIVGESHFFLIKNGGNLFKFNICDNEDEDLFPIICIDAIEDIVKSYDCGNLDITNLVLSYGRDILNFISPDKEIVDAMYEIRSLFHSNDSIIDFGFIQKPLELIKSKYPFRPYYGDNV